MQHWCPRSAANYSAGMSNDVDARDLIRTVQSAVGFVYERYGADVGPEDAAIIVQNQIAQSNLAIAAALLELAEAIRERS